MIGDKVLIGKITEDEDGFIDGCSLAYRSDLGEVFPKEGFNGIVGEIVDEECYLRVRVTLTLDLLLLPEEYEAVIRSE